MHTHLYLAAVVISLFLFSPSVFSNDYKATVDSGGGIDLYKYTHTCYEGKRPACGKCFACELRLNGFKEAGLSDPLEYEK